LKDAGVVGAFSLEPLKGKGLFVFEKALCFGLVEMLFGMGSESDFYILDRDVTAIEANTIRSLMSEACQVLNRAFAPLGPLDSRMIRVETNPRMLHVLSPDAEVIQIRFSIHVGDLEGDVLMVIPYFSLEPYKEKFREEGFKISEIKKESNWAKILEHEIMDMEISVSATWGDLHLTINEILGLEVGDIITMDYDKSSPIRVRAGKSPKFRAQPGLLDQRKAVRLVGEELIGE
jgi:flagellar motor switch protein FliM